MAILFRPFDFIAPKTLNLLAFQSFDFEGDSRNALWVLNLLFIILQLFHLKAYKLSGLFFFVYIKNCQYSMLYTNKMF